VIEDVLRLASGVALAVAILASAPSNYARFFDDCALGNGAILPKFYAANYRQFKAVGSGLKERIKMIKPNSKKSRHLEL
jgi:hypothetical protein